MNYINEYFFLKCYITYNSRIENLFENFNNMFTIYNYLNTFFTKYIFYIIIFFFRCNNDFVFLFKKTNCELIKSFTIIF